MYKLSLSEKVDNLFLTEVTSRMYVSVLYVVTEQ